MNEHDVDNKCSTNHASDDSTTSHVANDFENISDGTYADLRILATRIMIIMKKE